MQAGGAAAPQPPSAMPVMLQDDARYGKKTSFLRSKRCWNTFYPQNGGDYGPTKVRIIRFDITSDKFLDLSEMRLVSSGNFTAHEKATTTNLLVKSLQSGLGGTIERVTISTPGGTVIERIDEYGVVQCILNQVEASSSPEDAARLSQEELFNSSGTEANANSIVMPSGSFDAVLAHRFQTGFNRPKDPKLLPPNSPFRIEIELVADANKCMTTFGSTSTTPGDDVQDFTLSNVEIRCPSVDIMNDAFMESARRMMMSGWRFSGTQYKAYNYSASGLDNTAIVVPDASVCMTGILALSQLNSDIGKSNKEVIYTREMTPFQGTSNNTQQAYVGSEVYPKAPFKVNFRKYDTGAGSAATPLAPTSGMNNQGAIQQVRDVLGGLPTCTKSHLFTTRTGLIAFAIGEKGGAGVDTASTSTPVQLRLSSGGSSVDRQITMIVQKTAIYSLSPSPDGSIQISSVA